MRKTIYITLKVDYTFDESKTTQEDAILDAIDLAIQPCFHTIQNGTYLNSVKETIEQE